MLLLLHGSVYAAVGTLGGLGADNRVQVSLSTYGGVCDGVTDDTAAFLAFKAAFQGTAPVQLNLPAGTCLINPAGSGDNQLIFGGVADLVVAGTGAATTSIKRASGALMIGGRGQVQDNAHSLRTDDANAGDSCVIIKTASAVTVSAIGNNLPARATFTASSSTTTMTVTAVASGTILPGAIIGNQDSSTGSFNTIQPYGTAGTTGVGGTGTYALSVSATFSSQTVVTKPASFTASVATTGVMTVSAVQDGALAVGMWVYPNGGGLQGNAVSIQSQLTGSAGGTGTYQLDVPPLSTVSSRQFQGNGQPRVTLNSTAGLTSGDTLYLTGITSRGLLAQRTNGLRWIKVINGTQIDIFQSDYDGSYTSGGTGGGDRTSLTPVGSKVMMTGYVLQAYWAGPYGFPSNNHWFEFKTVASTNSGTHQVCFDTPLANSYKAAWPQYNTGNLFEVDPGGPATLYALDPLWEQTAVFKDFTLDIPGQTYFNGRSVTFENIKMAGVNCVAPTQNETHNWINVDASTCTIETDKLVGKWNITGGLVGRVHVQSSSMDEINLSGTSIRSWQGSPKKLTLTNSPISCPGCISTDAIFKIGTDSYGASDETICTNCSVSSPGVVTRAGDTAPATLWTMSGGVITIPNAISTGAVGAFETQTRYIVPGKYMFWAGSGGGGTTAQAGRSFKVVDVTQDLVNTYVQTSEAGGFPTGAWTTNGLGVTPHPAPKLTITNPTGVNSITLFGGCAAQSPMFSCANLTYTGGAAGTTVSTNVPTMWGELDTFTFTNNVPYTNTGSLNWSITQFGQIKMLRTDNVQVDFGTATSSGGMINMKLPASAGGGTRTLTPSGATGTQVGDTLTAPSAGAVFGGFNAAPIFSANTPSDSPQVTVTLRTNQNLPP
ncbi:hypothetical protein [Azospirillum sp.]|uniref:hypothetical protein n=1 Tax=Azospirillum sp. TaxID=34012 RepID=UPI002D287BCE|nr:hypothetical protein [Azospirillum sp.]HYD66180.1 hypothetical protein [Azospirillum sp.]